MRESASTSSRSRTPSPNRYSSSDSEVEDGLLNGESSLSGSRSDRKKNFAECFGRGKKDHVTSISGLLSGEITQQHIAKKLGVKRMDPEDFTVGMTRDEFIHRAQHYGLSAQQARQLASDVQSFIDALAVPDETQYAVADKLRADAEKLPPSATSQAIFATNVLAGATGYLSSFLWGKIFTSLSVGLSGSSHGAWIFPLVAGPLNVLLSEPLVGAIRSQGAFHPSVDGASYTDYNTASARLAKARFLGDAQAINFWTKEIAKIIDTVIDREQKHPDLWFRSGVEKPRRDAHGFALDQQGDRDVQFDALAEKVIAGARRRAFVTDEMPFLFFTLNYLLTGALQPWLLQHFQPAQGFILDALACAAAGTLSGAQTGAMQDLLRQTIQKSPLSALSLHIKGAKMAQAAARRDECLMRLNRVTACKNLLAERLAAIRQAAGPGDEEEGLTENAVQALRNAEDMEKTIKHEYARARKHHDLHAARHHRFRMSAGIAINAYLGEKSDPPKPLQGRRAINRVIAKSLATPLSLVFTPLYTAVVMPSILQAVSSSAALIGPSGHNFSDTGLFNQSDAWPASGPQPELSSNPDMFAWSVGLGALYGVPLILGYMTRNQFFSGKIEKGLAYLEALTGLRLSDHQAETETLFDAEAEDAAVIDLSMKSHAGHTPVKQTEDSSSSV